MYRPGDRVQILTNPKGTLWEYGYIEKIIGTMAKINHGLPDMPIYGLGSKWTELKNLRRIAHARELPYT